MSVRQKLNIMNDVKWEGELTMEDFVVEFTKRTPVLMKTITGILGPDHLHVVSSDEVYWITGLKKQKRIVAKMNNDRQTYLSIPNNYPLLFELYVDAYSPKKTPKGKSIDEIMKTVDFNTNQKYFIRAVKNEKLDFQFGTQDRNTARFGVLEIIDLYDEKYLVGHSIFNNQIHSNMFAIPVYMNLDLTVATSFVDRKQESFDNWFKLIQDIAVNFPKVEVKICEEIILFDKPPQNGAYEYMDPRTVAMSDKSIELLDGYKKDINLYVINKPKPPIPLKNNRLKHPITRSVDLPSIPRRTPPPLPTNHETTEKGRINMPAPLQPCNSACRERKISDKFQYERAGPVESQNGRYVIMQRAQSMDETNTVNSLFKNSTRPALGKPDSGDLIRKSMPTGSSSTPGDSSSASSVYEVKSSADVSKFSVRDVQRCLKLLNLEKYCELFLDLQVDGELLLSMEDEILTRECNFTGIEALKLIKFVHKGWRPNF